MASLDAEDIVKVYGSGEGAVRALDGITVTVEDQEFVSIVGPSGCGKTTFLRILDGLLEQTSGTIKIDGKPVSGSGRDRGMVFQDFNLLPWRTVKGNVELGLEAAQVDKSEREEVSQKFIQMVGLDGFEDAYPTELSGGMQQRVGLARALVIDPEILLMDEPLGALDAQTREIMQTELLKIWSAQKKTCVFVTHDIEEAIYLSDRIVVLEPRPGRIERIIDVPFDRPRYEGELKATEEFGTLREDIWDVLMGMEQDVLKA
jgi:NitT/TauT family transport system ATP-binding protein